MKKKIDKKNKLIRQKGRVANPFNLVFRNLTNFLSKFRKKEPILGKKAKMTTKNTKYVKTTFEV